MPLTDAENQVVQLLGEQDVAAHAELAGQLQVSSKTVQRALHKVGYYSSLNFNSRFVTLKRTARFDRRGLWKYNDICFSRHGNLPQTLRTLIEQSARGCTVRELEQWVGTRVANHLCALLRRDEICQFSLGRRAVYTAADEPRHRQQQAKRQGRPWPPAIDQVPDLPPGMHAVTVIRVLVQMIQQPQASVASISKSLQVQGVDMDADRVRQILAFYELKKTTSSRPRR